VLNNTNLTQSRPKLLFLVPLLVKPIKVWKILKTFFIKTKTADQDFYLKTKTLGLKTKTLGLKTKTKTFIFCPLGASRPRLWSRGLHHWAWCTGARAPSGCNVPKVARSSCSTFHDSVPYFRVLSCKIWICAFCQLTGNVI